MLPEDLLIAYQNFTLLATKHGYSCAGVMLGTNPPSIYVIGNVTEKGQNLVKLFQEYTKLIEEKIEKGRIEIDPSFRNN